MPTICELMDKHGDELLNRVYEYFEADLCAADIDYESPATWEMLGHVWDVACRDKIARCAFRLAQSYVHSVEDRSERWSRCKRVNAAIGEACEFPHLPNVAKRYFGVLAEQPMILW